MRGDRRRAIGLSESIRQQRRELLEMSLQQARNFSEAKREIQTGSPQPIAPAPVHQNDPVVVQTTDDPVVVQHQNDDREVVSTPKKDTIRMGKPHVVIVGADKGGVGKTFVSRAVLDYFKAQGVDARAFDTQQPDGNLKRFHPEQTQIVDLSKSDDQIVVFDSVPKFDVTVIDIQAGLLTPTLTLLSEIGFLDMVKDGKLDITVLHVIGSTVQSLNEIAGTAKILDGSRHFIVTNHTNDAAFFSGINGVTTDALKAGSALIDIPKMDERATEYVEAAATSFASYAKTGDSLVMKGKVGKWLKDVFAQFDAAKLNIK
jgi:hypothetical protein